MGNTAQLSYDIVSVLLHSCSPSGVHSSHVTVTVTLLRCLCSVAYLSALFCTVPCVLCLALHAQHYVVRVAQHTHFVYLSFLASYLSVTATVLSCPVHSPILYSTLLSVLCSIISVLCSILSALYSTLCPLLYSLSSIPSTQRSLV
jgi:hypothetical protein